MYFKMAANNVKKSFKDYTVYFLTLTFAVCIFYSFNSINSQTLMADLNVAQKNYIDLMNKFISILSVAVSVILGGLIIYATNFLIKRRKKEFGIYMTLGMRKKSMSKILFFETLFIGAISLVIGLCLGLVFAQVLSVFTAKLFDVEMTKYAFSISFEAIIKTIAYFGIMYILVMIFNILVISRYKLIDLLYAGRKTEKVKIRNPYISTILLFLSVIILGIAYKCIIISELDFFLIEFKLSIILGISGTILFFYSVSSLMILVLQKSDKFYLNGLNTFTIKQISSKFNTNFLSMSIICLMLLVTIGSLSSGLTVKDSMEDALKNNTPVDATFFINNDGEKLNNIDLMQEAIKKYDLNINLNHIDYSTLLVHSIDFKLKDLLYDYIDRDDRKSLLDYPIAQEIELITISDYNNFLKLRGIEHIELKDDEVIISNNYSPFTDAIEKYLDNAKTIKIKNKEYKIKNKKLLVESFVDSPISTNVFSVIVPDNVVNGNEELSYAININIIGENKEKILEELMEKISIDTSDVDDENNVVIGGYTREMCYVYNRGVSSIVLFITIYIGSVFLLASAAVLALQQLSECNDSIDRYKSLNKIGASKRIINKSIFQQVTIFFLLPLMLAMVHSYVGIKTVNTYIIALGSSNKIYPMLITALILIIVYGGYLYATYISYKNVINNEIS